MKTCDTWAFPTRVCLQEAPNIPFWIEDPMGVFHCLISSSISPAGKIASPFFEAYSGAPTGGREGAGCGELCVAFCFVLNANEI